MIKHLITLGLVAASLAIAQITSIPPGGGGGGAVTELSVDGGVSISGATHTISDLGDGCDVVQIALNNVTVTDNATEMTMRVGIADVIQTTAGYEFLTRVTKSSDGVVLQPRSGAAPDDRILLVDNGGVNELSNVAGDAASYLITLHGINGTTTRKYFSWIGTYSGSNSGAARAQPTYGGGFFESDSAITDIQFLFDNSGASGGTSHVYGYGCN